MSRNFSVHCDHCQSFPDGYYCSYGANFHKGKMAIGALENAGINIYIEMNGHFILVPFLLEKFVSTKMRMVIITDKENMLEFKFLVKMESLLKNS